MGLSREGSGVRPADLLTCKQEGRPIAALTAWDALSAALVEQAGADLILVGDSLAMVVLGHATTLPVTLEEMILHTRAVGRGLQRPSAQQPLIVTDLPFLSYQCGVDAAVAAAGQVLKDSPAAGVKLEGAEPETLAVVDRLTGSGSQLGSILRLDTSYGGGKTHALIGLNHILTAADQIPNLAEFIDPARLPSQKVTVAAFDGENADPMNGRRMDTRGVGGNLLQKWQY
jgi:hypothetical protein